MLSSPLLSFIMVWLCNQMVVVTVLLRTLLYDSSIQFILTSTINKLNDDTTQVQLCCFVTLDETKRWVDWSKYTIGAIILMNNTQIFICIQTITPKLNNNHHHQIQNYEPFFTRRVDDAVLLLPIAVPDTATHL